MIENTKNPKAPENMSTYLHLRDSVNFGTHACFVNLVRLKGCIVT